MSNEVESGWYPDPDGKPAERYWDGGEWTDRTRPQVVKNSRPIRVSDSTNNLKKQYNGLIKWSIIIIVALVLFSCFAGGDDQAVKEAVTQTASPMPELTLKKCESLSTEDLENIESGMSDKIYTIKSGYKANLKKSEIEEIRKIFPSYNDPLIIAATIEGVKSGNVIGIWALDMTNNRLIALDENARKYSDWGVDATDDSRTGQARTKLFELSANTSVLQCAQPVTINGGGDGQSKPFQLGDGNYEVLFETFEDCVYYGDLKSFDGSFIEDLFSAASKITGTNYIYETPKNEYYISVITGPACSWEVTFKLLN